MSSIDTAVRPAAGFDIAGFAGARPRTVLLLAIVTAACLGQLTALDKFIAVLTTGAFFDTDDAMRSVQVRDLIAGQTWFDMTQTRLDPPNGVFMHWSRVVDVPLVVLIKLCGLVADPVMAERLARLAFPFLLTIAFFALVVALCTRLLGDEARFYALAAAFLYGPATGQFEPGRIDHHAPQIVLLTVVAWGLAEAIVVRRFAMAVLAGVAMALSMAISVENVPFFAGVIGALVLVWIWDGVAIASALRAFAFGLAGAMPLVFAATVAPSRWLIVADDALSLSQLIVLLAVSGALVLLAVMRIHGRLARGVFACMLGLTFGGTLLYVFPGLIDPPFAHLDPMLRALWLDHVEEALPLLRKWQDDPAFAIAITAPALIGIVACGWLAARDTNDARRCAWFVVLAASLGGLAAAFLMVRTMSAVQALAVPGSLALVLSLREKLARYLAAFAGPAATIALILATSSVGWAAVSIRFGQAARQLVGPAVTLDNEAGRPSMKMCATPAAFSQLARLPKGRVLADPDIGGYILAHTHHSVVAGAYHRNERGMRLALAAFADEGERADHAIAQSQADYVVICAPSDDAAQVRMRLPRALRNSSPLTLRHLAAYEPPLLIYPMN